METKIYALFLPFLDYLSYLQRLSSFNAREVMCSGRLLTTLLVNLSFIFGLVCKFCEGGIILTFVETIRSMRATMKVNPLNREIWFSENAGINFYQQYPALNFPTQTRASCRVSQMGYLVLQFSTWLKSTRHRLSSFLTTTSLTRLVALWEHFSVKFGLIWSYYFLFTDFLLPQPDGLWRNTSTLLSSMPSWCQPFHRFSMEPCPFMAMSTSFWALASSEDSSLPPSTQVN